MFRLATAYFARLRSLLAWALLPGPPPVATYYIAHPEHASTPSNDSQCGKGDGQQQAEFQKRSSTASPSPRLLTV